MDLDGAVAGAGTGDEGAAASIGCVHADAGAGAGAAGFLDAALNVRGAGAMACEVEALRRAVGRGLACSCSILPLLSVEFKNQC